MNATFSLQKNDEVALSRSLRLLSSKNSRKQKSAEHFLIEFVNLHSDAFLEYVEKQAKHHKRFLTVINPLLLLMIIFVCANIFEGVVHRNPFEFIISFLVLSVFSWCYKASRAPSVSYSRALEIVARRNDIRSANILIEAMHLPNLRPFAEPSITYILSMDGNSYTKNSAIEYKKLYELLSFASEPLALAIVKIALEAKDHLIIPYIEKALVRHQKKEDMPLFTITATNALVTLKKYYSFEQNRLDLLRSTSNNEHEKVLLRATCWTQNTDIDNLLKPSIAPHIDDSSPNNLHTESEDLHS